MSELRAYCPRHAAIRWERGERDFLPAIGLACDDCDDGGIATLRRPGETDDELRARIRGAK